MALQWGEGGSDGSRIGLDSSEAGIVRRMPEHGRNVSVREREDETGRMDKTYSSGTGTMGRRRGVGEETRDEIDGRSK